MCWLKRKKTPETPEDPQYVERMEKVVDLSARLQVHRDRNGFGKMFDAALRVPPKHGGKA